MTPVAEKRKVPLLDLRALHQPIRDEVMAALGRVVDSNAFILGEEVKQLEKSIAAYCQVSYAIGCASGSDASGNTPSKKSVGILTSPVSESARSRREHCGGWVRCEHTPDLSQPSAHDVHQLTKCALQE